MANLAKAVAVIEQLENPPPSLDSDGETATCELCETILESAAEIRAHYHQKHPEVVPPTVPPTGEDNRDKYKAKKPDGNQGNAKNRRKSMPEKSLCPLSSNNGNVME